MQLQTTIRTRARVQGEKSVCPTTICTTPSEGRRSDIATAIRLRFTLRRLRRRIHAVVRGATPILRAVPLHDTPAATPAVLLTVIHTVILTVILIVIYTVIHTVILIVILIVIHTVILAVVHAATLASTPTVPHATIRDPIAATDRMFVPNRTTTTLHSLHHVVGHLRVTVEGQGVRVLSARQHADHRRVPDHFC